MVEMLDEWNVLVGSGDYLGKSLHNALTGFQKYRCHNSIRVIPSQPKKGHQTTRQWYVALIS
jgi:hypothetical protein